MHIPKKRHWSQSRLQPVLNINQEAPSEFIAVSRRSG